MVVQQGESHLTGAILCDVKPCGQYVHINARLLDDPTGCRSGSRTVVAEKPSWFQLLSLQNSSFLSLAAASTLATKALNGEKSCIFFAAAPDLM